VLHEGKGNVFHPLAVQAKRIGVASYPSDREKYMYLEVEVQGVSYSENITCVETPALCLFSTLSYLC